MDKRQSHDSRPLRPRCQMPRITAHAQTLFPQMPLSCRTGLAACAITPEATQAAVEHAGPDTPVRP